MLNLDNLNEAQKSAVIHGKGPMLVLAGPGSGKTTVVLYRIIHLVEVFRVKPQNIIVLTFTKEATLSLKNRFLHLFKENMPVYFGTFHSFFYQILLKSRMYSENNIMTLDKKKQLVSFVMEKLTVDKEKINIEDCLGAISYYKNTGNLNDTLQKFTNLDETLFKDILNEYDVLRKKEKMLDYDDILWECKELLKAQPSYCEKLRKQFTYYLLDEFQDINPIQYEILKLLVYQTEKNIFAVGDDDQAIYSFRGASHVCMKNFKKEFNAETVLLNVNYRSEKEIVDKSLKMMNKGTDRFEKDLIAYRGDFNEKCFQIQGVKSEEEQYQIIDTILKKINENEKCAVLFRTNLQLKKYETIFRRKHLKYSTMNKNIKKHFVYEDIDAYLQLINGMEDKILLNRIMNRPNRGISREGLQYKTVSDNKLIDLVRQLQKMKKKPLFLQFQYIVNVMEYQKCLQDELSLSTEERKEALDTLEKIGKDIKKYKFYEEWRNNKDKTEEFEASSEEKKITLMTIHASKGLEFEYVWIPDCNEGIYPKGTLLTEKEIEEERRIFYVAMTRAKKYLELSYLIGEQKNSRFPSQFIKDIME